MVAGCSTPTQVPDAAHVQADTNVQVGNGAQWLIISSETGRGLAAFRITANATWSVDYFSPQSADHVGNDVKLVRLGLILMPLSDGTDPLSCSDAGDVRFFDLHLGAAGYDTTQSGLRLHGFGDVPAGTYRAWVWRGGYTGAIHMSINGAFGQNNDTRQTAVAATQIPWVFDDEASMNGTGSGSANGTLEFSGPGLGFFAMESTLGLETVSGPWAEHLTVGASGSCSTADADGRASPLGAQAPRIAANAWLAQGKTPWSASFTQQPPVPGPQPLPSRWTGSVYTFHHLA